MSESFHKFRLATAKFVKRSEVLRFFGNAFTRIEVSDKREVLTNEYSNLILTQSAEAEMVYLELQLIIRDGCNFDILNKFVKFCKRQSVQIKNRKGIFLPPSPGSVYSELFSFPPYSKYLNALTLKGKSKHHAD